VITTQVRVTLPDGATRYYDGLARKPDGTYEGVEVKSGSASLSARQRAFDAQVDAGTPATGRLDGVPVVVSSTYLQNVK